MKTFTANSRISREALKKGLLEDGGLSPPHDTYRAVVLALIEAANQYEDAYLRARITSPGLPALDVHVPAVILDAGEEASGQGDLLDRLDPRETPQDHGPDESRTEA